MKRLVGFMAGAAVAALAVPAFAVTTKTWTVTSFRDFDDGEAKGVLIGPQGDAQAGIGTKRTDLGAPLAMSSLAIGKRVLLGSGDEGAVLSYEAGKVKPLAKLDGVTLVATLALSPDGKTVWAGGTPGGGVFAIELATGKPRKLATLEGGDHVWAIVPSADGKTLWVGTGPDGKLFSVDVASGKAKLLWDSGKKHLLSVLEDAGGLLVGASDDAELYRVDVKTGAARAVADFSGQEIKAIAVRDKVIYLVVNEFQGSPSGTVTGPAKPTGIKPKGGDSSSGSSVPRPGERKGKGSLWRIDPDGRIDQLHALSDSYFTSLYVAKNGDVFAASGGAGKVYLIKDSDRSVLTAFDVDERQVLTMAGAPGGEAPLLLGTGDTGAVYEVGGARADALYTSKVFEGEALTRWGGVRFSSSGPAPALETRSGNTASPDKTWSSWSKLAAVRPAPGGASLGKVASPPGRYLQWRTKLAGGTVLRDMTVYLLPQNQRTRVLEISAGDEPGAKKPSVTTQTGTTKSRSPVTKLKWKVDSGDDDEVTYQLEYRVEGDAAWRELQTNTGTEPFTKTDFDWNTELMPDGMYELRVTASDARSNPPELALTHSLISRPFLVDNQKPEVAGLVFKAGVVTGRVRDSFSRVDEIAYSVDGGDWTVAFPDDGVFDDVAETMTLRLGKLAAGLHTVAVRGADEADNVGVATLSFRTQ